MKINIENLQQVLESIEGMGEVGNMEDAMGKACALVERSAKQKAPKDTGELIRSISSRVENQGEDVVGVVFSPLEYAPYVEYGTGLFAEKGGRKDVPWFYVDDAGEWHMTSGQKPQPYLRPALDENREAIVRLIKEAMGNND